MRRGGGILHGPYLKWFIGVCFYCWTSRDSAPCTAHTSGSVALQCAPRLLCLCVWSCDGCELSQNKKVTSAQLRMHGLDPSVSEALTSPAKYDPYLSPSPSRLRIDAASAAAVGRSSSAAGKGPTPEVGRVMYPALFHYRQALE